MSEQERTPEEYARELGLELHGMAAERWDAYVEYLDSEDALTQASFILVQDEAVDLHAAFHADKWVRPENQERRVELWRALRELRAHRLADLQIRREALRRDVED